MSNKVEYALTVRWPFAGAILYGGKNIENRTQKTNLRGVIYIHQGQTPDNFDGQAKVARLVGLLKSGREQAHARIAKTRDYFGHLIGTVEIVDCVLNSKSPWAIAGEWQYVLANPKALTKPIAHRGNVGFWKVQI